VTPGPEPRTYAFDAVDDAVLRSFASEHDGSDLGPVTVLVPAFREAEHIGSVIAAIPDAVLGLPVRTLVVVDGPDAATRDAAWDAGAVVCTVPVNRGQGSALRLGYELARLHGAIYIVTIDADGQYDPAEIAAVLEPVVAGRADFVSGSRRLGSNDQDDRVREAGVVVYARLISWLTGTRVTDPSFGLRALRADVPPHLTLVRPQYQAAELLIGMIMRGYRVEECAATMRKRAGGQSHKGSNVEYAWRFGRVVVATWWRERRRPRDAARSRLDG
jgi:glycosyltransferase involved in cell wall biosynthesis